MSVESSGGRLPKFRKKILFPIIGVFVTAAALVGGAILYLAGKKIGIHLAFDTVDIGVYFDSARWITEGGRLYREVPSDYPLFANIIFAICRYLGHLLHYPFSQLAIALQLHLGPEYWGFFTLWVASAWFVYLFAVYRIATDATILAALAWLAPAPIYYALFRFDLYPAVATLMSLFAIRRTAYVEGAVWLGVAIALKGYALFLLPAYCVFMVYQRGSAAAIKVVALAATPMMLSLFATLTFAGWEGVVAPFEIQALRTPNGESIYDAINYIFGATAMLKGSEARWVGQSLQVGCALAAAAMRPRKFEDLVNAFLFAVLGFMSFSVFYSPQFVLWILPLICFSGSRVMLISAIFFSWLTYLYCPISYSLMQMGQPDLFKAMVVALGLLRLFMMFLASIQIVSAAGICLSTMAIGALCKFSG
jgi:uncharacterized membrane protein